MDTKLSFEEQKELEKQAVALIKQTGYSCAVLYELAWQKMIACGFTKKQCALIIFDLDSPCNNPEYLLYAPISNIREYVTLVEQCKW